MTRQEFVNKAVLGIRKQGMLGKEQMYDPDTGRYCAIGVCAPKTARRLKGRVDTYSDQAMQRKIFGKVLQDEMSVQLYNDIQAAHDAACTIGDFEDSLSYSLPMYGCTIPPKTKTKTRRTTPSQQVSR